METAELNRRVERQLENLCREFQHQVPASRVKALGRAHFEQLQTQARITDFIPVLVHRVTREDLQRSTRSELHRAA